MHQIPEEMEIIVKRGPTGVLEGPVRKHYLAVPGESPVLALLVQSEALSVAHTASPGAAPTHTTEQYDCGCDGSCPQGEG